jgi:hypothetical protein
MMSSLSWHVMESGKAKFRHVESFNCYDLFRSCLLCSFL